MNPAKHLLLLFFASLWAGCVSAPDLDSKISTLPLMNYRAITETVPSDPRKKVEPQFIWAHSEPNARALYKEYVRRGYRLLGYIKYDHLETPFNITGPTLREIMGQGRLVGAEVIITFNVPKDSVQSNVPTSSRFTPGTSSQTTIYAQNQFGAPEQIGSETTSSPGELEWQYDQQTVERRTYYVEFLAR